MSSHLTCPRTSHLTPHTPLQASEGYFIIKQMAGIDCTNLALTSPLRCLCETTIIFILLSQDVLTGHFTGPFTAFSQHFKVFDYLDDSERRRLFKFEQMMEVINRLFWKGKKRKGNFIALAARSTEGDGTTYNTGGASNVPTKCRELVFHAVTKIPIIPRPRRVVQHDDSDGCGGGGGGGAGGRKRKVDQAQAEMDERLNAELMKYRTDKGEWEQGVGTPSIATGQGYTGGGGGEGEGEGTPRRRAKSAGSRSSRTAPGYGGHSPARGSHLYEAGQSHRTRTAAATVAVAAAGLAAVAEAGTGARGTSESQEDHDEATEARARLKEEEVAAADAFGAFGAAVQGDDHWGVDDGIANMSQMSQFSQVRKLMSMPP